VFALHLHAFWFVALLFTLGDLPWLSGLAGLAIPLYTWLAMRRVYRDRWWTLLLRSALLSMLYLLVMGFVLIGVAVFTLLS
jgi:O-antigen/teichoic acid export membrane protein